MKKYKYVPVSSEIVVDKDISLDEAVKRNFNVIEQESVNGWEFVGVAPCTLIVKKPGFKGDNKVNTFIFSKED